MWAVREGSQEILHRSGNFGLHVQGVTGRHVGGQSIGQVRKQEWPRCHPQMFGRVLEWSAGGQGQFVSWLRAWALDSGDKLWLHHLLTI